MTTLEAAVISQQIPWIGLLFFTLCVCLASTMGAVLLVPATRRAIVGPPHETNIWHNLHLNGILEDKETIRLKDGARAIIIKLNGTDTTILPKMIQTNYYEARKNTLDSLARIPDIQIYAYSIRNKIRQPGIAAYASFTLQTFFDRYNRDKLTGFSSENYWMIVARGNKPAERLREARLIVLNRMSKCYRPIILSQGAAQRSLRVTAPLARIISPMTRHAPRGTGVGLAQLLCTDYLSFAKRESTVRYRKNGRNLYSASVEIIDWGPGIDENLILAIQRLPCENVITVIMQPYVSGSSPMRTERELTIRGRQAAFGATNGNAIIRSYNTIISRVKAEPETTPTTLWNVLIIIHVYHENLKVLEEIKEEIAKIASGEHNVTTKSDGTTSVYNWFAQFPSTADIHWKNEWLLNSDQIACLLTLDGSPPGLPDSDCGPGPTIAMRTNNGGIYNFQFQNEPPIEGKQATRHTVIIGGTGSGKTTLALTILGSSLKWPKHHVYACDANFGMEIFTRSIGGQYLMLDGKDPVGFNPWDIEGDNDDDIQFLIRLHKVFARLKPEEERLEKELVTFIERSLDTLDRNERSLAALLQANVIMPDSELHRRLSSWGDTRTVKGSLFNARRDSFSDLHAQWTSFNFTKIKDDHDLSSAMIIYLENKIIESTRRNLWDATMLIDEGKFLYAPPPMFEWCEMGHLQYRKAGIGLTSCFQSPEHISELNLWATLSGQIATWIILPNKNAKAEYYKPLGLAERELEFILSGGWGENYSALIKKTGHGMMDDGDSVIVNTRLDIGNLIQLMANDPKNREKLYQAIQAVGFDGSNQEALLRAFLSEI